MLITTDGNHLLKPNIKGSNASSSVIYVSGALGAAAAHLAYLDELDAYVPLKDGTLIIDEQFTIAHGIGVQIFVVVSGSDGSTNIAITLANKE